MQSDADKQKKEDDYVVAFLDEVNDYIDRSGAFSHNECGKWFFSESNLSQSAARAWRRLRFQEGAIKVASVANEVMSQVVSQSSSETSFKVVKKVVKSLRNQLQLLDTYETQVEGETMGCRKAKLMINKRKEMECLLPIVHFVCVFYISCYILLHIITYCYVLFSTSCISYLLTSSYLSFFIVNFILISFL